MNENTKTLALVAIAAGLLLVAFVTRPRLPYAEPEGEVNQMMFPDWKVAADAKSLQIDTFDDTLLKFHKFQIAEVNGRWVVPSHANFPVNADEQAGSSAGAEDHVVKAANALVNLRIMAKVSDVPGDHETYGVIEPDPAKLEVGSSGVGKLVVVRDASDKPLARLIIGKTATVPGSESSQNLRFVRRAGQDPVYVVDLNSDLFATKFADWIDPDLFQIKEHWNIANMAVRDYSLDFDKNDQILVDRKDDLSLEYNDQKGAWSVAKLTDYKDGKPSESKLAGDEELDTAKLNDMKQSLAGTKIIDVLAQPTALAADIKKQQSFYGDADALDALADKGFYATAGDKSKDLFSAGGDLTVQMKDGVLYDMRFGKMLIGGDDQAKDSKKKGPAKSEADKKSDMQRFVFVTAQFNDGVIAKPELEPLPSDKKPDAGKADAGKADAGKSDAGKASEPKKGAAPDAGKKSDKGSASLNSTSSTTAMPSANDPPAADKTAPAKTDDKKTEAKAPSDAKSGDAKAGEKTGDGQKPASGIKQAEQEQARDAERKRIEAANKTKTDAYNESIKKGKEHAKQLNDRFAGYFFLISEDDYKKVHLSRNEIIKKKLGEGVQDPFQKPATPPGGLIPGGLK